ncbi:hypothetical protein HK097_002740 [Rhizophlyctis rosea]|uniref:Uncharacterized protein n=1 Tax=Rhizophlyctis rosea TaxID=64517 RepID=A0AAD5S4E2_9FUNG|nr:hypothetical protein HK097_002740 [Rhizophlyctis rosea]
MGGRRLTDRDQHDLVTLQESESSLQRRIHHLTTREKSFLHRCSCALRPFKILFGTAALAGSVVVLFSVVLTAMERVKGRFCGGGDGKGCGGWMVEGEWNPVNLGLLWSSQYFPLDSILLTLVILYLFLCTLSALVHIGLRVPWIRILEIKRRATPPQGLLLATSVLIVGMLPLSYFVVGVAPQYAGWGNQVYCNATFGGVRDCRDLPVAIIPCGVEAPADVCTPTVVSTLIHRITFSMPFFGSAYYYSQWIFVAVALVGLVVAVGNGKGREEEEEEDEDLERAPLVR